MTAQLPLDLPPSALPRVPYQMPEPSSSRPPLVLVGEAPGRDEVKEGRPFVGRSGQLLDRNLLAAGIERRACLVANVFRFQPPGNKVGHFFSSRAKARRLGGSVDEQWGPFGTSDYCLSEFSGEIAALKAMLAEVRPAAIVALGRTPLWALTGLGGILERRGSVLPCRLLEGAKVVPTYHPSYILRGNHHVAPQFEADLRLAFGLAMG